MCEIFQVSIEADDNSLAQYKRFLFFDLFHPLFNVLNGAGGGAQHWRE